MQPSSEPKQSALIAHEVELWEVRRKEIEEENALQQALARKAGQRDRLRELIVLLIIVLGAFIGGCGHHH